MPESSAIRAGRAFVELFADDKALQQGLKAARYKLRRFGRSVQDMGRSLFTLGAAVAAPLAGAAKFFSAYGDSVAKMAKRTGLAVETLSELRFVASQTGTEFRTLENAFRKMQRSIYDAGRGLSTQTEALADLGLTYRDLAGKAPIDQFKRLADRIGKLEDATQKAAIAQSLFGRTGTNLIPMFNQGAAGIEELQEKARALGLTMREEDAAAAERFTDAMDALWKQIQQAVFQIGAALAPALEELAGDIARVVPGIIDWIRNNKDLIVSAAKLAAKAAAVGVALMGLGKIITGLSGGLRLAALAAKAFHFAATSMSGSMLAAAGGVGALIAGLGLVAIEAHKAKAAMQALADQSLGEQRIRDKLSDVTEELKNRKLTDEERLRLLQRQVALRERLADILNQQAETYEGTTVWGQDPDTKETETRLRRLANLYSRQNDATQEEIRELQRRIDRAMDSREPAAEEGRFPETSVVPEKRSRRQDEEAAEQMREAARKAARALREQIDAISRATGQTREMVYWQKRHQDYLKTEAGQQEPLSLAEFIRISSEGRFSLEDLLPQMGRTARGSFSGNALALGGGIMGTIAEANQQTARNTKRIADHIADNPGGLAFE